MKRHHLKFNGVEQQEVEIDQPVMNITKLLIYGRLTRKTTLPKKKKKKEI